MKDNEWWQVLSEVWCSPLLAEGCDPGLDA